MDNDQKYFAAGYREALKKMASPKSIKSSGNDIVIETVDDLKRIKQQAVDISEKWASQAWGSTPEGSNKSFVNSFKITPFDIEYKCTTTIDKYATPDSWADGRIISKWDDSGAGWPQGIGHTDINGSLLTVGTDRAKHPPYGVEDAATPIEWMITHLCDFYMKIWDSLEDSDAKSIRSVKADDPSKELEQMLKGYLDFLDKTEEMFYHPVYEPTKQDLEKVIDFGIEKGKELMEFMFEHNDVFVGQIAKDLDLATRNLSNVGNAVNKYLSSDGRADELEMQKNELTQIFDTQRKIQTVLKELPSIKSSTGIKYTSVFPQFEDYLDKVVEQLVKFKKSFDVDVSDITDRDLKAIADFGKETPNELMKYYGQIKKSNPDDKYLLSTVDTLIRFIGDVGNAARSYIGNPNADEFEMQKRTLSEVDDATNYYRKAMGVIVTYNTIS